MAEKTKMTTVAIDQETHNSLCELAAMATIAAKKKVTIKHYLRELVEQEKARNELSPKPEFGND